MESCQRDCLKEARHIQIRTTTHGFNLLVSLSNTFAPAGGMAIYGT